MNRRTALLAASAFFLSACGASGPPPPPPWSAVGTFSFTTQVPDLGVVVGSMAISEEGGRYGGMVEVEGGMLPPMAISSVDVGDMTITVQADFGGEPLFMELTFTTNDDYDGYWTVQGESGDISGSRIGSF